MEFHSETLVDDPYEGKYHYALILTGNNLDRIIDILTQDEDFFHFQGMEWLALHDLEDELIILTVDEIICEEVTCILEELF